MPLRTTHQWVDVVRGGNANVRVTRQFIEVLLSTVISEVRCSESITVSDAPNGNIFTKSISESITISDTAKANMFVQSLSEAITIGDLFRATMIEKSLSESITIDDSVHVVSVTEEDLSESIAISDTVTMERIFGIEIISESITVLDFVDAELDGVVILSRDATESITVDDLVTGDNRIKTVYCTEFIDFDDAMVASGDTQNIMIQHFDPDDLEPKSYLFTDPITGQLITITYIDYSSIQAIIETELVRTRTIREPIVIDDTFDVYLIVATGDHEEACTESITVTDIASITDHVVFCTESIVVTDTAVVERSRSSREDITITDIATVELILNKVITESINIYETLGYEVVSGISLCTYSPFIGGSSNPDAPTPPSATAPSETAQGDFMLYYPVVAPSDTVTLRGPESDDREKLHFQRIKRNSRGLSLQIFADPQWPKVKRLAIGVDLCTEAKAQEVFDFIILTTGQEIGFRDWRNRSWSGVIENPQNAIVRSGRDHWTIAIEFEAELTEL